MTYYKIIGNVKWYYCLIPKEKSKSLFTDHPRNTLSNKFIVCWDFYDEIAGKNSKIYAVFENYLDFAKFFSKVPQNLKCFYEIILGENIQKPHFDLDMTLTDEEIGKEKDVRILSDLINTIVDLLKEKNIHLNLARDICIYSSNGEKKRSYHVVINSYYHANNKEAKAFYFAVMNKLPSEYFVNKWIDFAVYSKTQQFRIYESCKSGSNRVKKLVKTWKLFNNLDNIETVQEIKHQNAEIAEDENHEFIINLEESIVSARPSICKPLPTFEIPEAFSSSNKVFEKGDDLDYDLAMEALNLLARKAGVTIHHENFPYRFDKIEGPFVILKRVKASKCRLCNRIHHHQNPYLLIVGEEKHVFFHCRRAPTEKKIYLGALCPSEEVGDEKGKEKGKEKYNPIINVKPISITWSEQKLLEMKELSRTSNNSFKSVGQKVDKIQLEKDIDPIQLAQIMRDIN